MKKMKKKMKKTKKEKTSNSGWMPFQILLAISMQGAAWRYKTGTTPSWGD